MTTKTSDANVPKMIKKAVIREDYVAVTGNWRSALILNQFVYWSERCGQIDEIIEEENARRELTGEQQIPLTNGWIYKKAEDLAKELMIDFSPPTIRRSLDDLLKVGLLSHRKNPRYNFDRTWQYRVNFNLLKRLLKQHDYEMGGRILNSIKGGVEIDVTPVLPNDQNFLTSSDF